MFSHNLFDFMYSQWYETYGNEKITDNQIWKLLTTTTLPNRMIQ